MIYENGKIIDNAPKKKKRTQNSLIAELQTLTSKLSTGQYYLSNKHRQAKEELKKWANMYEKEQNPEMKTTIIKEYEYCLYKSQMISEMVMEFNLEISKHDK